MPRSDSEPSIVAYIGDKPDVVATVPIKWAGVEGEARRAKLSAFLVGLSAHGKPELKLNYAAKDANDFAEVLKVQQGRRYENVEIFALLDGAASKAAVEPALARLKKSVGPDDTAVVFLAGSGVPALVETRVIIAEFQVMLRDRDIAKLVLGHQWKRVGDCIAL